MTATFDPVTSDGTITSWTPLTTVFTPPAACTTLFYLDETGDFDAFDPFYGLNIDNAVTCLPSVMTPMFEEGVQAKSIISSIGPMTCPSGWITAEQSVQDVSSTLAICCLPGYIASPYDPNVPQWCYTTVDPGLVLNFMNATSTDKTSLVWSTATTTLTNSTVLWAAAVAGWNIATSSTSSSITPTPTASASAAPKSGLSSGAAAGIGVGAAVGVLGVAMAAAALFVARRRRRRRAADAAAAAAAGGGGAADFGGGQGAIPGPGPGPGPASPSEMDYSPYGSPGAPAELAKSPMAQAYYDPYTAPAYTSPVELSGARDQPAAELDAARY